jgi:GNAT superfamily N-acetyltransferase
MIRNATLIDVPRMVDLAERFHAESALAHLPFNRDKLARVMAGMIDYRKGLALVAVRGGEVIGGFLGIAEEHFFSDALFSADLCIFIAPEHRGGFTAAALLRAYVRWAKRLGVTEINAGVSSGIAHDTAFAVFERVGFARTGVTFAYRGT